MRLSQHELNTLTSAVLMWTRSNGDTFQSVYQTDQGFVATTGHGNCLPGFYGSQQEAVDALEAK